MATARDGGCQRQVAGPPIRQVVKGANGCCHRAPAKRRRKVEGKIDGCIRVMLSGLTPSRNWYLFIPWLAAAQGASRPGLHSPSLLVTITVGFGWSLQVPVIQLKTYHLKLENGLPEHGTDLLRPGRQGQMKSTIPRLGAKIPAYLLAALVVIIIFGLGLWGGWTWWEGTPPELELTPTLKSLGAEQTLTLKARDEESGLSYLRLVLRQGDHQQIIVDRTLPGSRWRGGQEKSVELAFSLTPKAWGFQDGPAELLLEVRGLKAMPACSAVRLPLI